MADFSKPDIYTEYTSVLDEIRNQVAAATSWLDNDLTHTNIPRQSKRYNYDYQRIENWDGEAWEVLDLSGHFAASNIPNDAVTGSKILLGNGEWLRGGGGVATGNLLRKSTLGRTELNSATGHGIAFTMGGADMWEFAQNNYDLVPFANDTRNIGTAAKRVNAIRTKFIEAAENITSAANTTLTIGTFGNQDLFLKRNSVDRFAVDEAGFIPVANDQESIGTTGARLLSVMTKNLDSIERLNSSTHILISPSGTTAQLRFGVSDQIYFAIDPQQLEIPFFPYHDGVRDLGKTNFRFKNVFALNHHGERFTRDNGDVVFGATGAHKTQIVQQNIVRLSFETNGLLHLWNQQTTTTTPADTGQWVKVFVNGTAYRLKLFSGA